MMTSQILRSVDFTKSQKPRYLENETSFYHFIAKSNFVAEVTFKGKRS